MTNSVVNNLAGYVQVLLTLGIMLLGLAVMFRGAGGVGWLLGGIARLLAPLAGILLRGLVILVILSAIYLLVAQ